MGINKTIATLPGTKPEYGDLIDETALDWELTFIQTIIANASFNLPANLTFNGLADRRYK